MRVMLIAAILLAGSAEADDLRTLIARASVQDLRLHLQPRVEHGQCASWKMNERQVRQWFARAEAISAEEAAMVYDWGGCDFKGRFVVDGRSLAFSINAGGSAWVDAGSDTQHFGCKDACRDIFDFGLY